MPPAPLHLVCRSRKSKRRWVITQNKKYIPIAKRRDKPDAIAWILKHHPEIPDNKITKLIGTTKKTIEAIRERTHSNIKEIQPRDPVFLELCTQTELDKLIDTLNISKEN